jgi:hypothetical protein
MIYFCAVIYLVVLVFIFSICRVAARADALLKAEDKE